MLQMSTKLVADLLNDKGLLSVLTGYEIRIYAGPVPSNADVPLDMAASHTEIAHIVPGSSGDWGMKFETPTVGELRIKAGTVWSGTAVFTGANAAAPTLTATFFRVTTSLDDGTADATAAPQRSRVQGTVGTVGSGADLQLAAASYVPSATLSIDDFRINLFGA